MTANGMSLNERDPNVDACGPEDLVDEHYQVAYFDCTGDFPASRSRIWNVSWAASIQGIFGRRYSLHAGRGRAAWTTRKLRDPSVLQVDILQPVRLHNWV
jgi:hypothetical protein